MEKGTFEYKLVVAVRTDLKLSTGKIAVQVAHAAVSCAVKCMETNRKLFDAWYREGQRKIVVKVPGTKELVSLSEEAKERGLISTLIEDAGLTEVPPGTLTCVGIGPAREDEIDPITRKLQLM
jgi:PTH2 family peptidyl-tRNA hydrolase